MLVTVAAIGLGFSFGVKAWTEIKVWYIEGMYSVGTRPGMYVLSNGGIKG